MEKLKIILWVPEINHLISEFWLTFQHINGEPIKVIAWNLLSDVRIKQGWIPREVEGLETIILSRKKWWEQGKRIIKNNKTAIHIFYGFWSVREYYAFFLFALKHGVKIVVANEPYSTSCEAYYNSEPYVLSWIKVKIRPILYRLNALLIKMLTKGRPPCILPISLIAKEQFLRAGFNKATLFPFGYFIPKQENAYLSRKKGNCPVRLIYVGALIKRKGLDIAVTAIEALHEKGYEVTLDIYGSGDPNHFFSTSKCIYYQGMIQQGDAQQTIAKYDLLLLPSRHDGWGVVVNEALLQGVPVIASDRVGSKCLIEMTGAGLVFKSHSSEDLQIILESVIKNDQIIRMLKKNAKQVASRILPEVAAKYLLDVLISYFFEKGERPKAIWS